MATVTIYASTTLGGLNDGYIKSTDSLWTKAQAGTGTLSMGALDSAITNFGIDIGAGSAIWELFFPFNTSSLVGNSVAAVALTLYAQSYSGPTSGYLEARSAGDVGGTLLTSDWIAAASWGGKTLCAREAKADLPTSSSYVAVEFSSQAGFPGSINTGGTTWIAVAFDAIVNSSWPATDYQLDVKMANETGTTEDPRLVIEYQPSGNALFCGAQF